MYASTHRLMGSSISRAHLTPRGWERDGRKPRPGCTFRLQPEKKFSSFVGHNNITITVGGKIQVAMESNLPPSRRPTVFP